MRDFLKPELRRRGINHQDVWFQQDGATAQSSRVSMAEVRRLFQGQVLSRFGDVNSFPAMSPIWGFHVYDPLGWYHCILDAKQMCTGILCEVEVMFTSACVFFIVISV